MSKRIGPIQAKRKYAIYCDFDGTITVNDTTDYLLERLAHPSWRDIESEWQQGKIGSRECMERQVRLLQGGWTAIEEALGEVQLEPTFRRFAAWCQRWRIPLFVVSDGLDRVIHYLLNREGIAVDGVWANFLNEDPRGGLFLTHSSDQQRIGCLSGVCKCEVMSSRHPEAFKVMIGDGRSDFCWAEHADLIFAKSDLLDYCRERRHPVEPFSDFTSIRAALEARPVRETEGVESGNAEDSPTVPSIASAGSGDSTQRRSV